MCRGLADSVNPPELFTALANCSSQGCNARNTPHPPPQRELHTASSPDTLPVPCHGVLCRSATVCAITARDTKAGKSPAEAHTKPNSGWEPRVEEIRQRRQGAAAGRILQPSTGCDRGQAGWILTSPG